MKDIIVENVNRFIDIPQIKEAIDNLPKKDEIIIVINNSFIFRDNIRTNKNEKYLAFYPDIKPVTENSCFVVKGPSLKSDYSILKRNDNKITDRETITNAINVEKKSLGDIIFVLMGEIDESIEITQSIDHRLIKKITFSPRQTNLIEIIDDEIKCQSLDSEKDNWNEIVRQLSEESDFVEASKDALEKVLGRAFDSLKQSAFLNLKIPESFSSQKKYLLELIRDSIQSQLTQYKEALDNLDSTTSDRTRNLNEILRIAYNFVDDALTVIRLLISVCDLKPIVLWCTFIEHINLTESIKQLPWSRQTTKPSLNQYIGTVKKARNKSFHSLIPFTKAFEVDLPDNSLKNIKLRIFSEHGLSKKANYLDYKDKELVEVLMEFTRTSEELVAKEFWEKNLKVIEISINLITKTTETLRKFK